MSELHRRCDLSSFFIAVLTKAHAVVAVSHLGRHPNAYQRSALDFLHPTCAVEGCSSRDGLEYDHRASTSPKPISPPSTSSTNYANTTTARKPTTAGRSSTAAANGPSSPPTTAATPNTPKDHHPTYPHNQGYAIVARMSPVASMRLAQPIL